MKVMVLIVASRPWAVERRREVWRRWAEVVVSLGVRRLRGVGDMVGEFVGWCREEGGRWSQF